MFSLKKKLTKEQEIIASSVPLIAMIIKLMRRKQNGKKPFEEAFAYQDKMRILQETLLLCQKEESLSETLRQAWKDCAAISLSCVEQVKMESLKNDYRYLSHSLSCISSYHSISK